MAIVNDNMDATFADIEQDMDVLIDKAGQRGLQHLHRRTPRRTGFLDSRNVWERTGPGEGHWTNDASYAGLVEHGHETPGGSHVPANPFMQLAVDDTAIEFEALAQEQFSSNG